MAHGARGCGRSRSWLEGNWPGRNTARDQVGRSAQPRRAEDKVQLRRWIDSTGANSLADLTDVPSRRQLGAGHHPRQIEQPKSQGLRDLDGQARHGCPMAVGCRRPDRQAGRAPLGQGQLGRKLVGKKSGIERSWGLGRLFSLRLHGRLGRRANRTGRQRLHRFGMAESKRFYAAAGFHLEPLRRWLCLRHEG